MTTTARDYLVNRFQTDAVVLRERVALLARGTKVPGPDAATSSRMADACDEVVAMLLAIASHGDASVELDAIMALVPLLEHRATEQQSNPAIRSVYAGAATRIREVRLAEAQSSPAHGDVDDVNDVDVDDTDDDVDDDVIAFDEDDDITAAT
ncbi:MAG: hypothetical protein CK550_07835 [Gemmatimonadetes bacterium]|nr:MAG: hypothetical protein CK550_07835 [Gemmatimonadota bacterium]